jgi:hypothetical protein
VHLKRKLLLLFIPSWLSLTFGIVLSLAFVGITSFTLAEHSGRLGGFKLGTYLLTTNLDDYGNLLRTFVSSIHFTSVLFILFWIFIGFITYNIVFVLKGSMDESVGFLHELKYVNAKPGTMEVHVLIRFTLLIIAIILWVLFALSFSWLALPRMLNLINHSITYSKSPANVLYSFILFLVITHLAVILLRFTMLRARLSSSGE